MKPLIIVLAALALAACSMEARQVDSNWEKAQMASWDSMIANPHPQPATTPPTGLEGINAEGAIDGYNKSFWGERTEKNDSIKMEVSNKK